MVGVNKDQHDAFEFAANAFRELGENVKSPSGSDAISPLDAHGRVHTRLSFAKASSLRSEGIAGGDEGGGSGSSSGEFASQVSVDAMQRDLRRLSIQIESLSTAMTSHMGVELPGAT